MSTFSRRCFLRVSSVGAGALLLGSSGCDTRRSTSSPPAASTTSTYGYEEGSDGQAVVKGANGVIGTSGRPLYSSAAVLHGNFGVAAAQGYGATLTYALSNVSTGSGSLYLQTSSRGTKVSRIIVFKNRKTVLAQLLLLPRGGLGIAGATGPPAVSTASKAVLGVWTRVDWQATWDGASLAVTVHYFPRVAESATDYEQITTSFGSFVGARSVTIGSPVAAWRSSFDTLRLYDNADVWPNPFAPPPPPSVAPAAMFAIPGNPTQDGATVSALVINSSTVDLAVSPSADMSSATYLGATALDTDSTAKLVVSGLSPDAVYYARLATAPDAFLGDSMRFRTLPSTAPGTAFTRLIGFGSCQSQAYADVMGANTDYPLQQAWHDQLTWGADETIHVGDFGYWGATLQPDPTTGAVPDYTKHMTQYVDQMSKLPTMRQTLAWSNNIHQRDDHEISVDNGESYDNPVCAQNLLAMQKVFASPDLIDTADPPRGRYFSYNYGPQIKIIVVDGMSMDRSYTNIGDVGMKPDATFFGAAQLAWIKDQLLGPECLKIIVAGKSLLGDAPSSLSGSDLDKTWAYGFERKALMDYITNTPTAAGQPINCEWWGGDRHALGYVAAANNPFGRVSAITSSGYSMHGLPAVPGETYDWSYGFGPNNGQWVIQWMQITLQDDGLGTITRTAHARQTDCSDLSAPLGNAWAIGDGKTAVDTWNYV